MKVYAFKEIKILEDGSVFGLALQEIDIPLKMLIDNRVGPLNIKELKDRQLICTRRRRGRILSIASKGYDMDETTEFPLLDFAFKTNKNRIGFRGLLCYADLRVLSEVIITRYIPQHNGFGNFVKPYLKMKEKKKAVNLLYKALCKESEDSYLNSYYLRRKRALFSVMSEISIVSSKDVSELCKIRRFMAFDENYWLSELIHYDALKVYLEEYLVRGRYKIPVQKFIITDMVRDALLWNGKNYHFLPNIWQETAYYDEEISGFLAELDKKGRIEIEFENVFLPFESYKVDFLLRVPEINELSRQFKDFSIVEDIPPPKQISRSYFVYPTTAPVIIPEDVLIIDNIEEVLYIIARTTQNVFHIDDMPMPDHVRSFLQDKPSFLALIKLE